jgi:hypothetical protein
MNWPEARRDINGFMPYPISQLDIDDYNALPRGDKEKRKVWEAYKRLEELGEIEPITHLLEPPEKNVIAKQRKSL